ncbi:MAG: ribosome small subunit-dependent GTPase A [Clostridia bacterium]|nr:ribosome small subunit-dependent GTPase A [Clostridia bacterium]
MTGVIVKGIGGFYYVRAEDGELYECKARGIFRKNKITPMIGDKVEIEVKNNKGSIVAICDRTTTLVRPPVANIDALVLVTAAASPAPNHFLIDKMLVNVQINRILPIICINKIDIASCDELYEIYTKAGYAVVCTSAEKNIGIQALLEHIQGHVTAFAGPSGVGKSTILNMLTGMGLETGAVSDKIGRGKHTTRHVELLELSSGGFVLDTPGFSSFEVDEIRADELEAYFPEIFERSAQCRFRGCTHLAEPGCRVIEAVESGQIARSRYTSYKEIYNYLKTIKEWEK